jgi:hypothetical protein
MATSSSIDYNQTCIELIKDALVMVGAIEDEATPSAEQYAYTRRALNRMVKAWSVKGLKAWKWEEATLTLVDGTNQYDIGPGGDLVINRPIEIDNVRRVVSGEETEIRSVSRSEFMNQPAKDSEGKAIFVYYDEQRTVGQMWVWPTPDAADSIKFSYKSYIEDFDSLNDDPEFPPEWLDAIVYNLAVRLIPKYEVRGEDAARLTDMAEQLLYEAETNDTDSGSVFLMPEQYL